MDYPPRRGDAEPRSRARRGLPGRRAARSPEAQGVTQARLSKRNGSPKKWWTDDGSNRYKHDAAAIEAAINYIVNQPGMLAGVVDNRAFVVDEKGEWQFLE